jgi:hypothetical protein
LSGGFNIFSPLVTVLFFSTCILEKKRDRKLAGKDKQYVCIDNPLVFNLLSVIIWSALFANATGLLAVQFAWLNVHNT